ncbi:beta-defensin 132 [Octodon degus]|uniref:Beta-defensin 132 n=1 Tax=Octodon degus TaxID=10160 RepID=A0A6P3F5P6_OCTDE|nr:beta-defensin 132 [Octodon degus]
MKSLLLVFAVLGFLAQVAPASGSRTRCAQNYLGQSRLIYSWNEWPMLLCDRDKQCCVEHDVLPRPIMPLHLDEPKSSHRKTTQSHSKSPP